VITFVPNFLFDTIARGITTEKHSQTSGHPSLFSRKEDQWVLGG
jgi:hypothetical protein